MIPARHSLLSIRPRRSEPPEVTETDVFTATETDEPFTATDTDEPFTPTDTEPMTATETEVITATDTDEPFTPTDTEPVTATDTDEPFTPTDTEPFTATDTDEPFTPTDTDDAWTYGVDGNTLVFIQGNLTDAAPEEIANGGGSFSSVGSPSVDEDGWLDFLLNSESTNYYQWTPPTDSILTPTTNWTVEWFVREVASQASRGIMSKGTNNQFNRWAIFGGTGSGVSDTFGFYYGNAAAVAHNTADVTAGEHHMAVVKEGTNYRFYIDGVEGASGANANAHQNTSLPLSIGVDDAEASSRRFIGKVDRIRISNVARYTSNFDPPTRL